MLYDYHIVLASLGSFLGLIGYVLYYRTIFSGATKPHLFTWLIYAFIDALAFAAQLVEGGGPGAWVTLVSVVGNTGVAILAIRRGEKNITRGDWACFIGGLFGIVLWVVTSVPLAAVVIATLVSTLAIIPTLRKSYVKPFEESLTIWSWDLGRFSLGIVSLATMNLTTVLFPAAVLVGNATVIALVVIRRRMLCRIA